MSRRAAEGSAFSTKSRHLRAESVDHPRLHQNLVRLTNAAAAVAVVNVLRFNMPLPSRDSPRDHCIITILQSDEALPITTARFTFGLSRVPQSTTGRPWELT
jgi:hypothetical protein